MSHPGHEIVRCWRCGVVVSQCRCMSKDKREVRGHCKDCAEYLRLEQEQARKREAAEADKARPRWVNVQQAAFGNPYVTPKEPRIVVVAARYGGCYEPGRWVAIPVEHLDSAAFGDDISCSEWWHEHAAEVGGGDTPDEAILDWYRKRQATFTPVAEIHPIKPSEMFRNDTGEDL
jgi:hypothetical protein